MPFRFELFPSLNQPASSSSDRTSLTFFYERLRAGAFGILDTAFTTFLVLIAIRVYESGPAVKALLSGAHALGLLLSPLVVYAASQMRANSLATAAGIFIVGGCGFLGAFFFSSLPSYLVGSTLGMMSTAAAVPLITQMTHDNYPTKKLGYLFSRAVLIRVITAALFGEAAGRLLTLNETFFPWLLLSFAGALFFSAYCLSRCPSRQVSRPPQSSPWKSLHVIQADPLFRKLLIAWMVMGFGNLMLFYLRVEYVANPTYGLALPVTQIALLTAVIPALVRFFFTTLWGKLFDQMNFFILRILINLLFCIAILCFFLTQSFTMLIIGSLFFGLARSGGEIAWSLWVTKLAPSHQVADYMAAHTFLTGFRGFTAPFVAFYAIHFVPISFLAWIGAFMVLVSCFMVLPQVPQGQIITNKKTLTEEGIVE